MIPMWSFFMGLQVENTSSASKNSSRSKALWMLSFLKTTLLTASEPAMDPVWEDAALEPAAVFPDLNMTMGFLMGMFSTAAMNFSPSLIPSE